MKTEFGGLLAALRRLAKHEGQSGLPRLLTTKRAAAELGVSEDELMRMIARRRIRSVSVGGHRMVPRSAIVRRSR